MHLKAGDVMVQRGTIHDWINRAAKPCVIAFVLIDAAPVEVDGKPLDACGLYCVRRIAQRQFGRQRARQSRAFDGESPIRPRFRSLSRGGCSPA